MTGQFGKNHLGDRDEMLPTAHGFDEFFGNLYHLNAEEEPENADYPKNPEFKKKFGPRGVIHSFADGRITDTGPLTKKRMETIDGEVTEKALDFMERAAKSDKPFFLWWNSTRMHIFTHLKADSEGKTGLGIYADGMVEHDGHVGQVLAKLKELGLDENTIVMYSTDNGAETFTWPDGGTTMFRGEKNTQWEGGYRVPTMIKWPGVIKPGTVINDIGAHEDMLPTLVAAAGDKTVKARTCSRAARSARPTYKVHLDGYDLGPALRGRGRLAAQGVHLLDRRRQRRGAALRELEDHVPRAGGRGPAGLAGAVHRAARAEAHQPAHGSVRARRGRERDGLPALVHGAHVRDRAGRRLRRPVAAELPGVPAAPEAGQLQPRSRDGSRDRRLQAVSSTPQRTPKLLGARDGPACNPTPRRRFRHGAPWLSLDLARVVAAR